MSDFWSFFIFVFTCVMIGVFWDIYTPIFYLKIQTNKLFKKNLKILDEARDRPKDWAERKDKDAKSLYLEAVAAVEKEIADLKDERNSVLKLTVKLQDENKNCRDLLKMWREYLTNLEIYNNAAYDPYLGIFELMSDIKRIDLENKLSAAKKTIKEISDEK